MTTEETVIQGGSAFLSMNGNIITIHSPSVRECHELYDWLEVVLACDIPVGCTPTDARVAKESSFQLVMMVTEIRRIIEDLQPHAEGRVKEKFDRIMEIIGQTGE